jgi:hypothetical protein
LNLTTDRFVRFAQRCRDVDGVTALPVLIEEEADQRSVPLFASVELSRSPTATAMEGRGAPQFWFATSRPITRLAPRFSRYTGKKKLAKYF